MRKCMYTLLALLILAGASISVGSAAGAEHATLTYTGPATCLACHQAEANEVYGSAHYQWEGAAPYMVNGAPLQGKLKTSVNSY